MNHAIEAGAQRQMLVLPRAVLARVYRDRSVKPPVNGRMGKGWRRLASPFKD